MSKLHNMLKDFTKGDYVSFQDKFDEEVKVRIASKEQEIRQTVADMYFNETNEQD